MKIDLIPVVGNPGFQERQKCVHCNSPMGIKEIIWESNKKRRVSMECNNPKCEYTNVMNKGHRMLRYRFTVTLND